MIQKTIHIAWSGRSLPLTVYERPAGADLILFLHGLGCSGRSFAEAFSSPELQDYSLLAADLPGFGQTPHPGWFPCGMTDHAAVCEALLDHYPHRPVHLVVHSMAGAVGLLFSSERLAGLGSFINVEGNLVSGDCAMVSREASRIAFDEFERGWFPRFRELMAGDRRMALPDASALAFYLSARSLVKWSDSGRLLARFLSLPCPAAYVYGQRNADIEVLEKITDIQKIMIPGSGHFPMNDNPDCFYRELHRVISRKKG